MELIGDDTFLEFERVYATFKVCKLPDNFEQLKRLSTSLTSLHKVAVGSDDVAGDSDPECKTISEIDHGLEVFEQNDLFSDFFNNDEAFKAFERELEDLNVRKKTNLDLKALNRISGCDIVQELKALCDVDHEPTTPSCVWDWERMFSEKSLPRQPLKLHNNQDESYDGAARKRQKPRYNGCLCEGGSSIVIDPEEDDKNHLQAVNRISRSPRPRPIIEGVSFDPADFQVDALPVGIFSRRRNPPSVQETDADDPDVGYGSGPISEELLPSQQNRKSLQRKQLLVKFKEYNEAVPKADLCFVDDHGENFQGFLRVLINLGRPICMSLTGRPASFYEVLTNEHIVEHTAHDVLFYMPRDTLKSVHVTSVTTAKEVIAVLLKKFQIVDEPRRFALYEQQLNALGKIEKLRRLPDSECPLVTCVNMEANRIPITRIVLQENESGDIIWDYFSVPELKNFMCILEREEKEYQSQVEYKYKVMKRVICQRMKELRRDKHTPT